MKLKRLAVSAMLLTTLLVAACQATKPETKTQAPSPTEEPGLCRRDAADALAGKDRLSDAEARRMTGASVVRQIQPGQGVTMDYRQERVTIETDPKTGKIVRAFCG
ncbi:I78 family peptidase inhibitor [Tahibacter sp. UC22_41]|uniref:I78 family peptidase inhibitor n=1 Tax=Tahibacter sp. UC22_41 TaxID=3350178 RepID=UPI0036D90C2A